MKNGLKAHIAYCKCHIKILLTNLNQFKIVDIIFQLLRAQQKTLNSTKECFVTPIQEVSIIDTIMSAGENNYSR
jgi:hypothetical protein